MVMFSPVRTYVCDICVVPLLNMGGHEGGGGEGGGGVPLSEPNCLMC